MPPTLKPAITFAEKKDLDPAKLVRLYQQAPWAKGRTIEDAREMLRHTDVAVTAWDGDLLVGFGRVLTDYVYRATIWDVIVDKGYQSQGIGADIVQRILNHPRLKKSNSSGSAPACQVFMKSSASVRRNRPEWSGPDLNRAARNSFRSTLSLLSANLSHELRRAAL